MTEPVGLSGQAERRCFRGGNDPGDNRFFPSLGNHDWRVEAGRTPDGSPQAYVDYFTLPGPGYTSSSGNERYYDFQIGDMRFFAYDSDSNEPHGIAAGSTQANWLQTQLAASTATWNFVYMHHPPYSSGVHGNTPAVQLPYKAWGADAVFTGHDHNLERLVIGGLPYFVSGAGGKPSRLTSGQIGGSAFLNDTDNGALRMTVDGNVATFEFFSVANGGTLLDSFIIDKNQQALSTTLSFQQNVNGYTGTVDTYLAQSAPNTSFAAAVEVNVDSDDPPGTGQDNHVLLRFDNIFGSNAGQIPYNARLLDATLSLTTTNAGNGANLHRMLIAWQDTQTWTTAGSGIQADGIEAVAAADTSSGAAGIGTTLVNVLTSLEAWHDDPTGNFGWALLPVGNDGWDFLTSEGATPPRLDVTLIIAIDGDANFDGQVNALDLSILAANWQGNAKWDGGDFNADGVVNALDLSILGANWLASAAGGADFEEAMTRVGLSGVPEPGSLGVLACAALLMLPRRRG